LCDPVLAAHSAVINLRASEDHRICFFCSCNFRYRIRQLLIASNLRIYKFVFGFAGGLSIFNKMDLKFVQWWLWLFLSHCVWYHRDEHAVTDILEEFTTCIFIVIPKMRTFREVG